MKDAVDAATEILHLLPRFGVAFEPEQHGVGFGHAHGGHVDAAVLERVDEGAEVGAWGPVMAAAGLEN